MSFSDMVCNAVRPWHADPLRSFGKPRQLGHRRWHAVYTTCNASCIYYRVHRQDAVLATVAAVLHLGNISFVQSIADEAELDDDLSWTSLGHVSELLQVIPHAR